MSSSYITAAPEDKEYWEITPEEYEKRFRQRADYNAPANVLGYGSKSRFVPPLYAPEWLLSEIDRFLVTMMSYPLAPFMTEGFIKGIGNGDSWDLFWYNNAEASGEQLYPSGLSKYYDMYSWPGVVHYWFNFVWFSFCVALSPFTFGPINIWLKVLGGATFDDIWKILVPPMLGWFFHLTGEDGWSLY